MLCRPQPDKKLHFTYNLFLISFLQLPQLIPKLHLLCQSPTWRRLLAQLLWLGGGCWLNCFGLEKAVGSTALAQGNVLLPYYRTEDLDFRLSGDDSILLRKTGTYSASTDNMSKFIFKHCQCNFKYDFFRYCSALPLDTGTSTTMPD
jgi:hypothetical protein